MIIAILPNPSNHLAPEIQDYLTQRGIKTVMGQEIDTAPHIDVIITMGGDGTILHAAHTYAHLNAAIFGINLGHLGFMADVPLTDIYPSLDDLIAGAYTIENRLIIEGKAPRSKSCFALNDFVLHRGINPSLIELSIHLDESYVNTFQADGMVISTPNGSTAYSLAAGGPILTPGLEGLVLTPICAHTISNRPIVITPNQQLKITYLSQKKEIDVIVDGLASFPLHPGETLEITKSNRTFKLINLKRRDFYSTLRGKLGWTGKLRAT
ncbi:MAG: NAD(+)/NADH kinase [Simkaniaceae bacterium]|nr:NAD(+)/NADH kinase [Simkaniaceae bacterium]